jgi:hypothetical protein
MSIAYYEDLIDNSNKKIEKYRRQIDGLQKFEKETDRRMNKSSKIIHQRRNNIYHSMSEFQKHPSMKKFTTTLADAIDGAYEHSVSDNYQSVKDEIQDAIRRLNRKISDEKDNIAYYLRIIDELEEEERRRQEEEEGEE